MARMGTEYLDTLARQLGEGKGVDCRKRIASILERTKQECADGAITERYSAEETLMDRVKREPACGELKRARRKSKPGRGRGKG
jgi:hypothetical protein